MTRPRRWPRPLLRTGGGPDLAASDDASRSAWPVDPTARGHLPDVAGSGHRAGTRSTPGFRTRDGCPPTMSGRTGGWRPRPCSIMSAPTSSPEMERADRARGLRRPLRGATPLYPRRSIGPDLDPARSWRGRPYRLPVPRHDALWQSQAAGSWRTTCPVSTRSGSPPPSISSGSARPARWSWRSESRRRGGPSELRRRDARRAAGRGGGEVEWYVDRDAASLLA